MTTKRARSSFFFPARKRLQQHQQKNRNEKVKTPHFPFFPPAAAPRGLNAFPPFSPMYMYQTVPIARQFLSRGFPLCRS